MGKVVREDRAVVQPSHGRCVGSGKTVPWGWLWMDRDSHDEMKRTRDLIFRTALKLLQKQRSQRGQRAWLQLGSYSFWSVINKQETIIKLLSLAHPLHKLRFGAKLPLQFCPALILWLYEILLTKDRKDKGREERGEREVLRRRGGMDPMEEQVTILEWSFKGHRLRYALKQEEIQYPLQTSGNSLGKINCKWETCIQENYILWCIKVHLKKIILYWLQDVLYCSRIYKVLPLT